MRSPAFWLVFFLLVSVPATFADDMLLRVQRELRARKLFFGALDGEATAETTAAIRKFREEKGLDASSGALDAPTLRALGLPADPMPLPKQERAENDCCDFVLDYLWAIESGDWEREAPFYNDKVNYYRDGICPTARLRKLSERYKALWPQRKCTLLARIASMVLPEAKGVPPFSGPVRPEAFDEPGYISSLPGDVLVTAWVRNEVAAAGRAPRNWTEELRVALRQIDGRWKIVGIESVESAGPPAEPAKR